MRFSHFLQRLGLSGGWTQELWLTAIALAVGFGLMPVLIYAIGSSVLGGDEGSSVHRIFETTYAGLQSGSLASWIVLLGPYALYLIFRVLRFFWRLNAA